MKIHEMERINQSLKKVPHILGLYFKKIQYYDDKNTA